MKSFEDLFSDLIFKGKMQNPKRKAKNIVSDEQIAEEQNKELEKFLEGFKDGK